MQPFVSIILPVRNEEQYIVNCLDSIAAQDYPHDQMEILVVDGLSDDGTLDNIAEYDSRFDDIHIQEFTNPKQTVSAGLNIGFRRARGQVLIRMDAHARYGNDYISQCIKVMEKTGAANVGGPALALPGGPGLMAQAITLAHYSPFGLGGAQFRDPNAEGFVETVWPGCFKREVFDKIGYIDERRNRTEDIEFNSRLREAGYKIYLSPLIKAYYYCRTTLGETWRQRWADGFEITRFLPDNPRAPRLRHFIPLLFVSSLILLTALALTLAYSGQLAYSIQHIADSSGRLALRMLVLELGAYLGAMLFFVGQAGKTQLYNGHSKDKPSKEGGDTMGIPSENNGMSTVSPLCVNSITTVSQQYHNRSVKSTCSLLLLPLVFVTLHFSYGLGSLWGLISLPLMVNGKLKNR